MHMAKRLTDVCKRTVFFHVPNGEKRDAVTAGLLRQMGVRPGVADFILLSEGRAIAAEVKDADRGRQSKDQKGFQAAWEAQGGVYVEIRSAAEVEAFIFGFGLV